MNIGGGSDVEVKFGASAGAMGPGVNDAKNKIEGVKASAQSMTGAFRGVSDSIVGGFRKMAAGIHESSHALKEHQENLVGTAEKIRSTRLALMEIGEAFLAAFAIEQITEFAKKMGEAAESTYKAALTFGMTTSEVQRMRAEMVALGVAPEAGERAMVRLDRAFGQAKEGGKQAAAAFKAVGISTSESLTQSELWSRALEGMSKLSGPAKVAEGVKLFGRNIQELAPILGLTKEQMEEVNKTVEQSGAVNDVAEQKGLALAEAFNTNKVAMMGLNQTLTDALAPTLTQLVTACTDLVLAFTHSYQAGGTVKTVLDGLAVTIKVVASAVILLYEGAQTLVRALLMVGEVVGTLAFAFSDVLWIAIRSVIDVLGTLAKGLGDIASGNYAAAIADFSKGFDEGARHVHQGIERLKTELQAGMKLAGQTGMNALRDGLGGADALQKIWGKPGALPALPKAGKGTTEDLAAGGTKAKGPGIVDQWRTELQEALTDEKNFGADEAAFSLAFWQSKLSQVKAGSKEELEIRREVSRAKRAVMLEEQREELASIRAATDQKLAILKGDMDAQRETLGGEEDLIAQRERLNQINAQQAAAARSALHAKLRQMAREEADAEYDIHRQEIADELKVDGIKPEARAALNRQLEQLEVEHAERMKKIDASDSRGQQADVGAQDEAKFTQGKSWVDPIVGAWTSGLKAMEQGTGSFRQMVLQTFDAIAGRAIDSVGRMVTNWVMEHVIMRKVSATAAAAGVATHSAAEAAKTSATVAGVTSRAGAEHAGFFGRIFSFLAQAVGIHTAAETAKTAATTTNVVARTAAEKIAALSQVATLAGLAGAGGVASMAAAPFPIDLGAPAFGASMAAAAAGYGALASAAGGWDEVPKDQVAMVHEKEMILPASIATPLRSALKGGFALPGGGGLASAANAAGGAFRGSLGRSGGDIHLTHAPQITNPDADLKRLLATQGRHMRDWMRNEMRNNPKTWGGKPA